MESPSTGMEIVCVSVLFCIVLDHLTSTFAPWSVSIISPRASCLEGSKAAMECGSMLEIRRNVKNAKEYNAVNCMGNCDVCVAKVKVKVGVFYVPFNSQGHIGTGPQNCHLWDSNPQR